MRCEKPHALARLPMAVQKSGAAGRKVPDWRKKK